MRTIIVVIISSLTIAGLVVFVATRQNTHIAAANDFQGYLRKQDWGAIYDQSPEIELKRFPITKQQYIKFLTSIVNSSPQFDWELATVNFGESAGRVENGEFVVFYTLALRGQQGKEIPKAGLQVLRSEAGWHACAADLPLAIARLGTPDDTERFKILVKAMKDAGIAKFPANISILALDRGKLEEYIARPVDDPYPYVPR